MNYNIFLFGIITIMFTTILYNTAMAENEIPQWIKTVILWWGEDVISDAEFISALKYLIDYDIIKIAEKDNRFLHADMYYYQSNDSLDVNPIIMTNSNFEPVFKNSKYYKNRNVEIQGSITDLDRYLDAKGYLLDMNTNFLDPAPKHVYLATDLETDIIKGNCYTIIGTVYNEYKRNIPLIKLHEYEDISCIDFKYPAVETLEINDIEEDGSIKITLKKIIFTDDHTRILLSIENQRRYGDISFYELQQKITQNDIQYNNVQILDNDDEILYYDIAPRITKEGYIFFKPIPTNKFFENPFSVIISMYDDNDNEHNIEFHIKSHM